jgi:hypothetical protein
MLDEKLSSMRTRQAEMKTFNVTLKTELEAQKENGRNGSRDMRPQVGN